MTLLDDLQALDLSAVVEAKVDIQLTLDADDLKALVSGGAVVSVLGDVGVALQAAMDGFEHPQTLVAPIVDALSTVLEELAADLDVGAYVDAVAAAGRIVADLVGGFAGDPHRISFGGQDVGTALQRAAGPFGDQASAISGSLARFRGLVEVAERGLPTDAGALLGPALEILLPFPTTSIEAVRGWAGQLDGQFGQLSVDVALTTGLVSALGRIRVAAQAGDAVALQAALDGLAQVRANTVNQLAGALRRIAGVISGLRIGPGAAALTELRGVLGSADDTVFGLLDDWRAMIASVRETVEGIDATVALTQFSSLLDVVEQAAETTLLGGLDEAVEAVERWLRNLLREVPIRPLRHELSEAIATAARAVADADLTAPIETVRGTLAEVSRLLTEADPAALVQAAVDQLVRVVHDAIDALAGSLSQITDAVNAVADQARDVLERAVAGLQDLKTSLDQITTAIEDLDLTDVAAEIAAKLTDLREQVSTLLAEAPIPEPLRAAVEQLIGTLESIDLDEVVGAPLRELAAQLEIPADVATTVSDGLAAVNDAVTALVPDSLVAELDALLADALAELGKLDVSALTSAIGDQLDRAAAVFDDVRFAELLAPAGDVFGDIVAAVDRVHPRVVLRPAIDLYQQVLGAVPVPDPVTITTRAGAVTSQAAEAAARAAIEPARQAVDPAARLAPSGPATATSGPPREEPPADLRPGDIVRLIGFLPARLRETLAGLGAGGAGQVLAEIDDLLTATARALRTVSDRVAGLDAVAAAALDAALRPVAAAQVDALLALQGSVAFDGDTVRLEASLDLVAAAGPGALQTALAGERRLIGERAAAARGVLSGTLADDLDQVATLLEALLPSGLLADADAFLAALDPEPIAAELDALLLSIVNAMPAFLTAAADGLRTLEDRIRGLIETFNPGSLMQRYLKVLDVLREELALLDPARLADELGQVHAEVKAALLAYDPVVLAGELDTLVAQVVAAVRGLSPDNLLPDLTPLAAEVGRLADIVPVAALDGIGDDLTEVGATLLELDLQGMLDAVNALPDDLAAGIDLLVESVRDEIVALLKSIRYASAHASVSVSVSGSVTL